MALNVDIGNIPFPELYIVSRYMYRIGNPIIADATYDELHEMMMRTGELPEYTSRTYDDDPIPMVLLNKFGIISMDYGTETKRDSSFLIEDKSKSIKKVNTMREVYEFCQHFPNLRKVLSVKMDGNNIKSEISDGELKLSLTRGRASNGIDVTDAMMRIMPRQVNVPGHRVIVGEVFLPEKHLEYVRAKYGGENKYKTSKSSAISFLRRHQDHAESDYALLDFRVFACDGLASTVEGTYQALEAAGFSIPPYIVIGDLSDEFDEFEKSMLALMDTLREKQLELGLPADGLVLELDDHLFETQTRDQYDDRQIALKFHHWKALTYQGVITSIIIDQRRVFCCCKVTIEPLVTDDGCEATMINTFNPSFLINEGLKEGSIVEFERQSGTVNIMINGKKVKASAEESDE